MNTNEIIKALNSQKNKAYSSLDRIKHLQYSEAEVLETKKLLFKSGIRKALDGFDNKEALYKSEWEAIINDSLFCEMVKDFI